MDTKDLSPAYFTSLAALLAGALLVSLSSIWLAMVGWVLVFLGLGLNVFSTLVIIQRLKGGPLPGMLIADEPEGSEEEGEEEPAHPYIYEEAEPITESQEIVAASEPASDERIFKGRPPRPHVR